MRRVSSWVTVGLLLACVGGPASPAAAAKPEVVYVHDIGDPGRIFAYAKDRFGTLTALPGSPYDTYNPAYDCLNDCHSLAYSPEKRLLFAAGIKGISVFEVARNGVLGPIPGSPFGNAALAGVGELSYKTKDAAGTTRSATFTITIADDGISAADDDGGSIQEGAVGTLTGSVFDNDDPGADGFGGVIQFVHDGVVYTPDADGAFTIGRLPGGEDRAG